MATLYIDRPGLELRHDGEAIALYDAGQRRRTLPRGLIDRVVVQGDLAFTGRMLTALVETGASVVFLSKRNSRQVAQLVGAPHNDARIRLGQYALAADMARRENWARVVVHAKVRGQRRFIEHAIEARPDCRKPLFDAREALLSIEARTAGGEAIPIDVLRGYEGAAARAYFGGLPAIFPEALGFSGRNRRPPRDPVNACLSLGYTLVHAECVACAYAAGLDPYIGFFHEPSFKRESLACDLVEPLRPEVDAWTWNMFRSRQLREDHFNLDKGACLLGKVGRKAFFEAFQSVVHIARRRLRARCRLVVRAVRVAADQSMAGDDEEWS